MVPTGADSHPHPVQLEGLVEILGNAWDWHAHCVTRGTARVHVGGDVARLGFDFDLEEQAVCHVDGSVRQLIVFGAQGAEDGGPIAGSLRGTLEVDGNLERDSDRPLALIINHGELAGTGRLTIGGSVLGVMSLPDGQCAGVIDIGENLIGRLLVGTAAANQDFTGRLWVHGNVGGVTPAAEPPRVIVAGNLAGGQILVDGSLGASEECTLSFSGANYGGVVTIDFDGYDASDRWGPYGLVSLDGTIYTGEYTGGPDL